jgi:hypothetical protein
MPKQFDGKRSSLPNGAATTEYPHGRAQPYILHKYSLIQFQSHTCGYKIEMLIIQEKTREYTVTLEKTKNF